MPQLASLNWILIYVTCWGSLVMGVAVLYWWTPRK